MVNVDNVIIEHLRAMRTDIASIKDDVREVKTRITHVEAGIASLKRDTAHQYDESAAANARFDRLTERIEKIERRWVFRMIVTGDSGDRDRCPQARVV